VVAVEGYAIAGGVRIEGREKGGVRVER